VSRASPPLLAAALAVSLASCSGAPAPAGSSPADSARAGDPIVVVGAGVAGLSAAVEAASAGAEVVVVDRWSVFGGGAILSDGGLALVATPTQQAAGIADSAELAAADFAARGVDVDQAWARRYAGDSRAAVHDWLTAMGVAFTGVVPAPGNRVARLHRPRDGGLGLTAALYRNALALGVRFHWNEDVTELTVDEGRVVGVRMRGVRDGRARERRAAAVILATGGFTGDVERVQSSWPGDLPVPERILAGSGAGSLGVGLDLARQAGGALRRMDHVALDPAGVPDPRVRGGDRGLRVDLPRSIWVNRDGRRFVDESGGPAVTLAAALHQPGAAYWAILDADGARAITVEGPAWRDPRRVAAQILDSPLVARGDSLAALARAADLPGAALEGAVATHNLGSAGFDLARPPFYAIRLYPLARGSLGGVAVDDAGRVLRGDGDPVDGLYAAGEVTGFAGIGGRDAVDGALLGASVMMGRSAGRAATAQVGARRPARAVGPVPVPVPAAGFPDADCTSCHPPEALALDRPGWQHVAASHGDTRAGRQPCAACHAELYPYRNDAHRIDPMIASDSCRRCHLPR